MTGPLSSADRANLITDQREMEGGGGGGKVREERRGGGRREERELQLLTGDSHSPVNTRYEILTEQRRLYEKCMTSCSELTSQADRGRSRGLVSELSKCV